MLSIGQRLKLIASIPTKLGDVTAFKRRKDRFKDPGLNQYPSLRISIPSQNIPMTSTWGITFKDYSGPNGDAYQRYGGLFKGTCSILVESISEESGTDDNVLEELDKLLYYLGIEIEMNKLDLWWTNDRIKVIPGTSKINYLPVWEDKHSHGFVYGAAYDFSFNYEFAEIDPTPNLHAVNFDFTFGAPDQDPVDIYGSLFLMQNWFMDIILRGSSKLLKLDILNKKEVTSSCGMDIILVNDSD